MSATKYVTLGPAGSNHDLVLRDYLRREDLTGAALLCDDFDRALEACACGAAHRILICAAHGDCGRVVGVAQYRFNLRVTDVFLAESQPLAILHKADKPKSIALHPATRTYADLSDYDEVIEVASTVAAAEGLAKGDWDAALTAVRFATAEMTVAHQISPPRDAWLVLGGEDRREVWTLAS